MHTAEAIQHLKSLGYSVTFNEKGRYLVKSGAYRADYCYPADYKGKKTDYSMNDRKFYRLYTFVNY